MKITTTKIRGLLKGVRKVSRNSKWVKRAYGVVLVAEGVVAAAELFKATEVEATQ